MYADDSFDHDDSFEGIDKVETAPLVPVQLVSSMLQTLALCKKVIDGWGRRGANDER